MAFQNFYATKLQTPIGASDTSIVVQTPPTALTGRLVLEPRSATQREIISYTGVAGVTLTGVTRGLFGTTAKPHTGGALVEMNFLAEDYQDLVDAYDSFVATNNDWRSLIQVPTMVSSDGQRQHKLRYTGVDYSGIIPTGAKLKIPRTGTTPTTSMAFVAASSQYASKSSPTGITFTDDFTCEAWIYLDSYGSDYQGIISRRDGDVSGFSLALASNGQLEIASLNASAYRLVNTYQSIPLGKWTHVAATVDLSGTTWITYIDGVVAPNFMSATSGAMTAIIQPAQPLALGYRKAGLQYFNGKIANARVWSTIRTAAEIRDNMNKENPASTTGLVAHFKGNGSWNDSSSNANHLTAVGGAVNNSATHPYSATEYAIATKVEYTGGNTDVTVFTGSNCLPNETLGATSYSTARAPYGFPADRKKWAVSTIFLSRVELTVAPSANNSLYTYQGDCARLTIPTGAWNAGYNVAIWATRTTGGALAFSLDLANNSTTSDPKSTLSSVLYSYDPTATSRELAVTMTKEAGVSLTTSTVHYLNFRSRTAGMASAPLFADYQECRIYAECAYL